MKAKLFTALCVAAITMLTVSPASAAEDDGGLSVVADVAVVRPACFAATLIGSSTVNAAFAKGMPLIESPEFKIHAARRDAPGVVEIHSRDTDIFHIIDGAATIVTGGKLVNPTRPNANNSAGTAIEGGVSQALAKGDFVLVPEGVPHWFSEIKGSLTQIALHLPRSAAQ